MLQKSFKRFAALVVSMGVLLQFGGCLNMEAARRFVWDGVAHEALEFVFDNDGILDLFADTI